MFKIRWLLVIGLGLALVAQAQAANPYNGTWKVSFDGTKTEDLEGTVVVNEEGGSWHMVARSQKNPCVGREAPIAVQTSSETDLVFEVQRSKILANCKDWTMKLKRVDERTLKGEFSDGRVITLQRK